MRLTVRPEQMEVIEAVAQENFVRKIADHLRRNYSPAIVQLPDGQKTPVSELPEETLHDLVRVGIERARSYELTFESAIAAFVAIMFDVAPNFDTHRLCQVLLNDKEVVPNQRIDELVNVLNEKNWDSIREDYDPKAWEPKGETEEPAGDEGKKEPVTTPKAAPASDFQETVVTGSVEKEKSAKKVPEVPPAPQLQDTMIGGYEEPKTKPGKTPKAPDDPDYQKTVIIDKDDR